LWQGLPGEGAGSFTRPTSGGMFVELIVLAGVGFWVAKNAVQTAGPAVEKAQEVSSKVIEQVSPGHLFKLQSSPFRRRAS
jgi:hypothetical protein